MTVNQNATYSIEEIARLPSAQTLGQRRAKIQCALPIDQVALISAGLPQARNFPANHYPDFRASSHFLYLAGQHISGAILALTHNSATLYHHPPTKSGALWHGAEKSFSALSLELGCDVISQDRLPRDLVKFSKVLSLPTYQANTHNQLRD